MHWTHGNVLLSLWEIPLNLNHIFLPNCLLDNILMAKTFNLDIDNNSDHVPIPLNVSYSSGMLKEQDKQSIDSHGFKQKVHWSRFSHEEINEKFVAPLLTSLASFDHDDLNDVATRKNFINKHKTIRHLPIVHTLLFKSLIDSTKNKAREQSPLYLKFRNSLNTLLL